MNILKKLFGCKDTNATAQTVDIPAYLPTYTVGWEIHTNSSSMLSRKYSDVPENQREDVYATIAEETEGMYKALNEAAANKNEFVSLEGNVLRLSDVSKICIVNAANTTNK